ATPALPAPAVGRCAPKPAPGTRVEVAAGLTLRHPEFQAGLPRVEPAEPENATAAHWRATSEIRVVRRPRISRNRGRQDRWLVRKDAAPVEFAHLTARLALRA